MAKERRRQTDKLLAEWFWTDAWTGSRGFSLPMEPRGLYREMLTQAWRREAKLPNDPEEIRRITGCSEKEWKRCWPKIAQFWIEDGGDATHLVNVTQVVVYLEAKDAVASSKARAQAGANAMHERRKHGPVSMPHAPAHAVLKHSVSTAQALPSISVSISDRREKKEPSLSSAKAGPVLSAAQERAGRLREDLYPAWYAKHRDGARLKLGANSLEYLEAVKLCETWDDARLEQLAAIVLTTDDGWISTTDRSFKIFAMKASWADDRLRQAERAVRA